MDPFEKRTVYVADSPMGEGIYAKRDIVETEMIAYYNGFIYNVTEEPMFPENLTSEEM